MTGGENRYVSIGQFDDARQASEAIAALENAGFSTADITLLIPVSAKEQHELANTAAPGANRGA